MSRVWMCGAPALALLVPGIVAVLAHQVILFASLSPTAVTLIHQAGQPSARPYNAVVGHLVGLASACLFVVVLGLSSAPSVFEVHSVSGAAGCRRALVGLGHCAGAVASRSASAGGGGDAVGRVEGVSS